MTVTRLSDHSRSLKPPAWTVAFRGAWPVLLALAVGLLAMDVVRPSIGGYPSTVMLLAGINIILAVSLTVVNGFTGQFSIGHAGFMAVGGYVGAAIMYYGSISIYGHADFMGGRLSWSGGSDTVLPWLGSGDLLFVCSCLAGGAVAAAAGYVVGLPSLRLRGDYLAIVTLGFGEIVRVLFQGTANQPEVDQVLAIEWWKRPLMLGGAQGFTDVPTYTTLFWVYFFVVVTVVVCYRLKVSSTGRAFLSIREDEVAAQAMGVDVTRYKIRAFVLSSFFAGLAGALFAMDSGTINAGSLGFQKSFSILIMVVLGGMGSISGAVLAAVVLTILPEALLSLGQGVQQFRLVLYALLLIGMMILRPQGLFGLREIWEVFGGKGRR
jgi:branched-chain amino acid transport system permease protein